MYSGFSFITKTNVTYRSITGSSTIPILKPEAVTGNLPDRLVTVWCSLSGQKEVLVEEAQFVPFKLDCPTSYNKQSGLALGRLLCQWKNKFMHNIPILDYVNSSNPNTIHSHIPNTSWNVYIRNIISMVLPHLPWTGWQSTVWTWNSLDGNDSKNSPRASCPEIAFPFHTSVALSR